MSFRNLPSSAAAVDTGAGVIPGVKIYSDKSNPGAGIVEWDAYTARALAQLTSTQTGSGGSSWTAGIVGGPGLALNIEAQADGGNVPRARVTGVNRWEPTAGPAPLTFPAPTLFDVYDPTHPAGGGWTYPRAHLGADGMVHVRGMVLVKTAGLWGAGQTIAKIPAPVPPPGDQFPVDQLGFNNRLCRLDVLADGSINWNVAVSADLTFTAGAYLMLRFDYLPA